MKFTLRGTKPDIDHDILVEVLNPDMAHDGLFGKGTYFAEHPTEINQYVRVDTEEEGGNLTRENLRPAQQSVSYRGLASRQCFLLPRESSRARRARSHHSAYLNPSEWRALQFRGTWGRQVVPRIRRFDKRAIKLECVVVYTRTEHYACGNLVREHSFRDNGLRKQ